uniref:Perilipin n=1 Tax=Syphacia muris TaxID=451379 RepID=A0A0N5AK50_9BILA
MLEITQLRKELTRLDKETKIIQDLWSSITINNSWEALLVNTSASLDTFNKLMLLSVTNGDNVKASVASTMSYSEFKTTSEKGKNLKFNIVQAINEAVAAMEAGQTSMQCIAQCMETSEILLEELPKPVKKLKEAVENAATQSSSLERHFSKTTKTLSSISSTIGRSGFMLLEQTKLFWSSLFKFYDEVRKMIEYTLTSSCNALINLINIQQYSASKSRKYTLKSKHRDEIYRASLSVIAYVLSIRHLANAYIRYSVQTIMPQLIAISRYPLVAHSEIELVREMHQTLRGNRIVSRRKSILELDLGLQMHLSDMPSELDQFLTPIANFRKGQKDAKKKLTKQSSTKDSEAVLEKLKISSSKKWTNARPLNS